MANFKKEIDKDLLYKKLMPSNFKPSKNLTNHPAAEEDKTAEAQADYPIAEEPPRKPTRRVVNIPSMGSQKTELVNLTETAVLEKYDSVTARFNCCRCDRCKKDIIALALNKLPPKYAVLNEGQLVPDVDQQLSAQVVTAMIQAVLKVRAKPRH